MRPDDTWAPDRLEPAQSPAILDTSDGTPAPRPGVPRRPELRAPSGRSDEDDLARYVELC